MKNGRKALRMSNSKESSKNNSGKMNKTNTVVGLFLASALIVLPGCGTNTPAPYNGPMAASEDYCRDDNNDDRCDDSGDNIDRSYGYFVGGIPYYGKRSSISSGRLHPQSAVSSGPGVSNVKTPSTSSGSGSFNSKGSSGGSGSSNGISSSSGSKGGIGSSSSGSSG
jgi:hypothetical protein